MLLRPTVSGLCAMLQTIYETESCFSSASTDSHHQPLELLSGNRGSSTAMPTTAIAVLAHWQTQRKSKVHYQVAVIINYLGHCISLGALLLAFTLFMRL
ncbi:histone deacetylase 5-like protein, partial [Lates japonicus]